MEERKVPRQEYVLNDDKKCPFCDGKLSDDVYISNPPERKCNDCGKFVTVYSV